MSLFESIDAMFLVGARTLQIISRCVQSHKLRIRTAEERIAFAIVCGCHSVLGTVAYDYSAIVGIAKSRISEPFDPVIAVDIANMIASDIAESTTKCTITPLVKEYQSFASIAKTCDTSDISSPSIIEDLILLTSTRGFTIDSLIAELNSLRAYLYQRKSLLSSYTHSITEVTPGVPPV